MISYITINCNGRLVSLQTPAVMGIVNITSDSFYKHSRLQNERGVLDQVEKMATDGAAWIDIGVMSSRPGAAIITPEEEWARLDPFFDLIRKQFPEMLISVDTLHAQTAQQVLDRGADMINDISGGTYDDKMLNVVGRYNVPFVMMHMQGLPKNMQDRPEYEDVVTDIFDFFTRQIEKATDHGITDIVLDPGFGFGKTLKHNYRLLRYLDAFEIFRYPVMVGVSRKGMIQKTIGRPAEEALNGTTAVHMLSLMKGARILRVHDVREAVECVQIWEKYKEGEKDYIVEDL